MGCKKSKIPPIKPENSLHPIGLPYYDDIYAKVQAQLHKIDEVRTELDVRFTYFIRSLGTSRLWETNPDFKEIFRITLIVLAINGKDEIKKIEFEENSLSVKIDLKDYKKAIHSLIKDFLAYIEAMKDAKVYLESIQIDFTNIELEEFVAESYRLISDIIVKEEYTAKEMILILKRIDANNKVIKKEISSMKSMLELPMKFMEDITLVINECNQKPILDGISQQVAQAMLEGLTSPEALVKYFWPYPH